MKIKFLNFDDFGKSKDQLRQEQEEYERSVFPYGSLQKENVRSLLSQIHEKKLDQIDLMIAFIEGKQKYLRDPDTAAVFSLIRQKRVKLTSEQIRELVALVLLDAKCTGPENLPRLEQVRELARSSGPGI